MFFTAYHSVNLLIFAVVVVIAAIRVFKLRNTPATYNGKLFTFAYFSFGAWILWVLEYVILVAAPFISLPRGFFLNTDLGLGVIQSALWATAVLSLHFKLFSRTWLTLPLLGMFSAVVAVVTYRLEILTSEKLTQIEAVSAAIFYSLLPATIFDAIFAATFFIILAISIVQLRLSKVAAAFFLIHGYSQWIWRWLWLTPLGRPLFVQVAVPLWRIALLVAWIRLISEMVQGAQSSAQKFDSV